MKRLLVVAMLVLVLFVLASECWAVVVSKNVQRYRRGLFPIVAPRSVMVESYRVLPPLVVERYRVVQPPVLRYEVVVPGVVVERKFLVPWSYEVLVVPKEEVEKR